MTFCKYIFLVLFFIPYQHLDQFPFFFGEDFHLSFDIIRILALGGGCLPRRTKTMETSTTKDHLSEGLDRLSFVYHQQFISSLPR